MTGSRRLVVEADGGSRGNPGPAGYGAVVRDAATGKVLAERAEAIGRATNNVAEYRALIAGLQAAHELAPAVVEVRMDSKLVVEQMSGRWKVRHPDLAPLAAQATALARSLPAVRFGWVPREANKHADRLANEAMDAAAAGRAWTVREAGQAGEPRARTGGEPSRLPGDGPGGEPSGEPAPEAQPGWSAPAAPPTSMVLLRHGETAHSPERRFSGRGALPLTARGLAQAEAAAGRLAERARCGVQPAAVLASPLPRALVTAERVSQALGIEVSIDDGLVETDFGAWEGLTFSEVKQRWPAELAAWLASPEVAPPGGESVAATTGRVRRARDRILRAYPGRTVVVVSHVTPIKTLLRLALDAPAAVVYRIHLDVGGLSVVDWYADGPGLVRLVNDTSHLAGC